MNLSRAPAGYSADDQDRLRKELIEADKKTHKTGQDVEIASPERIIIASPNGARWALSASNAGALTLVAA